MILKQKQNKSSIKYKLSCQKTIWFAKKNEENSTKYQVYSNKKPS